MMIFFILLLLFPFAASSNLSGTDYRETVTIGACDVTISNSTELSTETWDGVGENVYCLTTGVDYTASGVIVLDVDGTSGTRKVLRTVSGSSTHPVDDANKALLLGLRIDADYWTIDGASIEGADTYDGIVICGDESPPQQSCARGAATNTIISRSLIEGAHTRGILILASANNTLVQENVIRDCRQTISDTVAVAINSASVGGVISDTHVYHNETYNCGQGVQLVVGIGTGSTYPGTVIAGNDFYDTSDWYIDCGTTDLNPAGPCSLAEAGIAIKGSTTTATGHIQILDNRIWGYRRSDTAQGPCVVMVGSWDDADYVLMRFNICGESAQGLRIGDADQNNASIIDNIVYAIDDPSSGNGTFGLLVIGDYTEVYRNSVINVIDSNGDSDWGLDTRGANNDISCNVFINADAHYVTNPPVQSDYNMYYSSVQLAQSGAHDKILSFVKSYQLCYDRKLLTGPEESCIPYGAYRNNICDYDFSSRSGIGVDNGTWPLGPNE